MPKIPDTWPHGALPGRMNDECTAYFLGVSVSMLRAGVRVGRYPAPIRDGGRVLWLTADLQEHVDRARQSGEAPVKDAWLARYDDDRAAQPR
jgi:hypothetical protein